MRQTLLEPKKYRVLRFWAVMFLVMGVSVPALLIGGGQNHTVTAATAAKATKHLRQIVHRPSKALCGRPVRGMAACAAYVTTDGSGSPLPVSPANVTGPFSPTQFHTAYQIPCDAGGPVASTCPTPGSFGPTIAIVDAGSYANGSGTVEQSLQNYDTNYGLPACTAANGCLQIVNQQGATSPLPGNVNLNWSYEIVLDVEAVHMICQHCKILLVETNDNANTNLTQGMLTAQTFNPVAINLSFYTNAADVTAYNSQYSVPGIALVAATGDSGRSAIGWPSDNPGVLAVAGTTLQLNTDNTRAGETVWSGSGGACAQNYSAPAWQTSLSNWSSTTCGSQRAFGDVSAAADPNTGMYVNLATGPSTSTWQQLGGTSLAAPIISGILGIIGRVPAGTIESSIPYSSNTAANFLDIISGITCTGAGQTDCTARVGFDSPSGIGSPIGLGGFSPPPSAPTGLAITQTTHTSASFSWTAASSNVAVSNYAIYRDGTQIGTTSGTSYTDSNAAVNHHYTYSLKATDILNNVSPLSTTAAADTYYNEDVNEDGHINLLDLSLLASTYGQSGPALGRSDMNTDGSINLLDLSLLASNYGVE